MYKRLFIVTFFSCICLSSIVSESLVENGRKTETISSHSIPNADLSDTIQKVSSKSSQQVDIVSGKNRQVQSKSSICPPMSPTCPECVTSLEDIPTNICEYTMVLKVLLIAAPQIDSSGRICGKFGLLSTHRNTSDKEFRRLLRFSLMENCTCQLKSSQHYFLLTDRSSFLKKNHFYHQVALSRNSLLVYIDMYSEVDIRSLLKDCSTLTTTPEPSGTDLTPDTTDKLQPRMKQESAPIGVRSPGQPQEVLRQTYSYVHLSRVNHSSAPTLEPFDPNDIYYSPDDDVQQPPYKPPPPVYPVPLQPTYAPPLVYPIPLQPTYAPPPVNPVPLQPTYAPPPVYPVPLQPTYAPPSVYPVPLQPTYAPPPKETPPPSYSLKPTHTLPPPPPPPRYPPPPIHPPSPLPPPAYIPSLPPQPFPPPLFPTYAPPYGFPSPYAPPLYPPVFRPPSLFTPDFSECLEPPSCPQICAPIDGGVDFVKTYCDADYALLTAITLPERYLMHTAGTPYGGGECLKLRTKVVKNVSKGGDPKDFRLDLSLLLFTSCDCFSFLKGPKILLLLGKFEPIPSSRRYQLTRNHNLFLLPAPSTITLPVCPPNAPPSYPAASVHYAPFQVTSRPLMVVSNASMPYLAPTCPFGMHEACPECLPGLDQWIVPLYCSAQFAVVAEPDHSAYSVSYSFPIITVTATTIYSSKRIVITISTPPKNRCIQGSLKIIQPIILPWTLYSPPRDVVPFVALAECPCPFLTLGYGQKLLVFSSEAPSFLPNGALQLSKDIYVVPLPAYAPLPNCASLYIHEHVPDEVPSPPPPDPYYTSPVTPPLKTTPSPKVYTPVPSKIPVYTQSPRSKVHTPVPPQPPVYTPEPPPPPVYTPAPPSKVYTPAPPPPSVYTPAPPPPPVYTPEPPPPPVYTPAPPPPRVYTPAPPPPPVYTPAPPPPPVYTPAPPPPPVYTPAPPVYTPAPPPPPVYTPAPPPPPVYTPAPPPPPVYTPAPPPPPVYTPAPPPPPIYTHAPPPPPVYTPAPPPPPVYTPAPPPPPVYTPAPPKVYTPAPPPPLVYTPAPPGYTPAPPPVYTPKPYLEPIANVPPPPALKPCPLPTRTCPICSSVLPQNFSEFYCLSSFALIVAIGLDFKVLLREKEDPRIMPFIPAEKPDLSLIYDSSKYAYKVTVIPEKTAKKISHASYGDACYKEKVRGIQEISKGYEPYEVLSNLEIYVPEECKCETLDMSPTFGVLLSQTRPPDLNQPLQLSDSFVLFPLPQVETPIPSCNPSVPPSYLGAVSAITYGALRTHSGCKESPCFEDCDDSPCEEDCHILPPGLTVPCDAKAVVLIEILETSAGPYVVPTLTISEHAAEYYGYPKSFWLHVRPNDPYREPSTYGDKEPLLKNCKYLKAKVVLDLSPYPSLTKGDVISIIAGPNCNHKLFLQANGYAVLISKVALSPNAEIPLAGNILKCIPTGITILTLCPANPIAKPPPPTVYNTPLPDPYKSTPVPYVPPVTKAYVPPTRPPYPPSPAPYVPASKAYVPPTSPPYPPSPAQNVPTSLPSPAPPVVFPDPGCPEVLDNSCPICLDSNALDLAPEPYCKAKLALMLKSTGKFTDTSPSCVRSDVFSLFDVTTDRGASKTILAVQLSLPSRCLQECPALDGEGFVLALFPEGDPPRETPLSFQLTSSTHLVLMKPGKLSLPGCKDRESALPRTGEGKTVQLETTPLEWRTFTKNEDLPECPQPFHSCPVCEPLSDDQLENLICSSDEVYAVSTEENSIGLKPLSNKKVFLTQSAADDVTAHIEIDTYKHEDVCTQPLRNGTCNASLTRYYYDSTFHTCEEFKFRGCETNGNNFESEIECEKVCKNYDTCNNGRLNVLETIQTTSGDELTEIDYAIPDHCECSYLLSSQKSGYYMYNASAEQFSDVYHLTQEFRLVPITDEQAAKRFKCEKIPEDDNDNDGNGNADTDIDLGTDPDTDLDPDANSDTDDYEEVDNFKKRSKDDPEEDDHDHQQSDTNSTETSSKATTTTEKSGRWFSRW